MFGPAVRRGARRLAAVARMAFRRPGERDDCRRQLAVVQSGGMAVGAIVNSGGNDTINVGAIASGAIVSGGGNSRSSGRRPAERCNAAAAMIRLRHGERHTVTRAASRRVRHGGQRGGQQRGQAR